MNTAVEQPKSTEWLTTRQTAALLGRSEDAILRELRHGRIKAQRPGRLRPLFRRSYVEALANDQPTGAA